MTLAYRRNLPMNGRGNVILLGYGAYGMMCEPGKPVHVHVCARVCVDMYACERVSPGISLTWCDTDYSPVHAVLLSMGFVLAYCHVRGGGEGRHQWEKAARKANRLLSFSDLEVGGRKVTRWDVSELLALQYTHACADRTELLQDAV
jgi:protease II